MNNIKSIRDRLGLTQTELAQALDMTQGNVSFYERGQMVPPNIASKLIDFAHTRGCCITFNDVYMPELAVSSASIATEASEFVAQVA